MAAKYHAGNLPPAIEAVLRQIATLEEDLEFWLDDSGVKIQRPGQVVNTDKLRRRVVSILNEADATSVVAKRAPDEPPPASRFTDQEVAEAMCTARPRRRGVARRRRTRMGPLTGSASTGARSETTSISPSVRSGRHRTTGRDLALHRGRKSW